MREVLWGWAAVFAFFAFVGNLLGGNVGLAFGGGLFWLVVAMLLRPRDGSARQAEQQQLDQHRAWMQRMNQRTAAMEAVLERNDADYVEFGYMASFFEDTEIDGRLYTNAMLDKDLRTLCMLYTSSDSALREWLASICRGFMSEGDLAERGKRHREIIDSSQQVIDRLRMLDEPYERFERIGGAEAAANLLAAYLATAQQQEDFAQVQEAATVHSSPHDSMVKSSASDDVEIIREIYASDWHTAVAAKAFELIKRDQPQYLDPAEPPADTAAFQSLIERLNTVNPTRAWEARLTELAAEVGYQYVRERRTGQSADGWGPFTLRGHTTKRLICEAFLGIVGASIDGGRTESSYLRFFRVSQLLNQNLHGSDLPDGQNLFERWRSSAKQCEEAHRLLASAVGLDPSPA